MFFRWGDYLGLPRWALNAIICILTRGGFDTDTQKKAMQRKHREQSEKEDARLLALKMEGGVMSQGMQS